MPAVTVETLLDRLFDASSLTYISAFLKDLKLAKEIPRRGMKTSGTAGEVRQTIATAVKDGILAIDELARFVDECEENGSQSIYLFTLTEAGKTYLSPSHLSRTFPAPTTGLTDAMYGSAPNRPYILSESRDELTVVRHIYRASIWERDEERSFELATEKATYWIRRQKRAVNVLLLDRRSGDVEIRIDRVFSSASKALNEQLLAAFLDQLAPTVSLKQHLAPVPIWDTFGRIAAERDGTYMNSDQAQDASVVHGLSRRRSGQRAQDIRDDARYDLNNQSYARNELPIYWDLPADRSRRERLYTHLSRFPFRYPEQDAAAYDLARVWIPGHATQSEVTHVLGRIRALAS